MESPCLSISNNRFWYVSKPHDIYKTPDASLKVGSTARSTNLSLLRRPTHCCEGQTSNLRDHAEGHNQTELTRVSSQQRQVALITNHIYSTPGGVYCVNTETMTLTVPASKIRDIRRSAQRLLHQPAVTITALQSFVGKALAKSLAVFPARLNTRQIIQTINQMKRQEVNQQALSSADKDNLVW